MQLTIQAHGSICDVALHVRVEAGVQSMSVVSSDILAQKACLKSSFSQRETVCYRRKKGHVREQSKAARYRELSETQVARVVGGVPDSSDMTIDEVHCSDAA